MRRDEKREDDAENSGEEHRKIGELSSAWRAVLRQRQQREHDGELCFASRALLHECMCEGVQVREAPTSDASVRKNHGRQKNNFQDFKPRSAEK